MNSNESIRFSCPETQYQPIWLKVNSKIIYRLQTQAAFSFLILVLVFFHFIFNNQREQILKCFQREKCDQSKKKHRHLVWICLAITNPWLKFWKINRSVYNKTGWTRLDEWKCIVSITCVAEMIIMWVADIRRWNVVLQTHFYHIKSNKSQNHFSDIWNTSSTALQLMIA